MPDQPIPLSLSGKHSASTLSRRLTAWRPGAYLRASAGLFGWLLLRAMAQAVLVIALARLLGATDYGHFITVLAVATFFTPLAGLGLHGVLLRDGARNPQGIPQQLGTVLRLWWPSTVLFGGIGAVAALLVLPDGAQPAAIVAVVLAEVASGSLVELMARVQQARHHTHRFGAMLAGLVLIRVAALILYSLFAKPEMNGWMWAYAAGSLTYVAWLLAYASRELVPVDQRSPPLWPLAREGIPFALGSLSLRLQSEFNKPVLAQLGFALAGNFSVAQRVLDIASLPLMAMQEALWARLFASVNPERRMHITAGFLVLLALFGGVMLYLMAPLLPLLLGPGFEQAIYLLQWLALLPAIQVIRNFANFQAIKDHRTYALTTGYVAGGASSVILNIALVLPYGAAGAIIAAYASELIAILSLIAMLHLKKEVYP